MLFFLIWCIAALVVGRRVGWMIGALLYSIPATIAVPLSILWAVGMAYAYRVSIAWLHPNWLLVLLGFGCATYLSNPAYKMAERARFPYGSATREDAIEFATFFPFLIATAVFYFKMK